MTKLIIRLDRRIELVTILYLFFALMWLGNGFDKFFDGKMEHDTNPNVAKFAVLDAETGELEYRIQKYRIQGIYGSNRSEAFREYFGQLGLSYETSQFFLYFISVIEIILGLVFLYIFLRTVLQYDHLYEKRTLFGTRTLHRLAFKVSTLLFVSFVTFDILVGDRVEHWEHGFFFLLVLFAYYLFIQNHKIEREEEREILAGWNGIERRGLYSGKDRRKSTNEIFNGEERRGKGRGRRAEDKTGEAYQPRRVQEYITDNDRRRGEAERRKGPRKKVDPSLKQQFGNEPPIIY